MQSLSELNAELEKVLAKLNQVEAEDDSTDELVSHLHELVGKRQLLLDSIFANVTDADAAQLKMQLSITQSFEVQAKVIKEHRQSLLHVRRKSKRQLNIYKAIDAN